MNISVDEALQLLKLERPVTNSDIKKAYRKAAMQYHPDKTGDIGHDYFNKIRHAFILLQNITADNINQGLYKKQQNFVAIPNSLLYNDLENIFYLYHSIKNSTLFTCFFYLYSSSKKKSNLVANFIYIIFGFLTVLCVIPALLGSFILLSIPYLLYVLIFETIDKYHQSRTGYKLRKTATNFHTLILYISVRCILAILVFAIITYLIVASWQYFPGIIMLYFTGVLSLILSVWIYSIIMDMSTAIRNYSKGK